MKRSPLEELARVVEQLVALIEAQAQKSGDDETASKAQSLRIEASRVATDARIERRSGEK